MFEELVVRYAPAWLRKIYLRFAYPYALIHKGGVAPCKGEAYLLKEVPKIGSKASSEEVRTLEGEKVPLGSSLICGSCRMPMMQMGVNDVVKRGWW